jgi:predicted permease
MRADFAEELRSLPPAGQVSFAIRSIADAATVGVQERWIQLTKDAAAGLRVATRAPISSALAVITISLAVFVATVLATLLSAVFLTPLPVSDPASLVLIWETDAARNIDRLSFDEAGAQRLSQVADLKRVGWMTPASGVVSNGRESVVVRGASVSDGYLSFYAPRMVYGGDLQRARAKAPIVISEGLWRDRFDADEHLVGKTILLDGVRRTVVGIAAPFNEVNGFQGRLTRSEFWIPIDVARTDAEPRFLAVGRIRDGASPKAVERSIAEALAGRGSQSPGLGSNVIPVRSFIVEPLVRDALVGTAAAFIVVLLAYANIAILFSSRAAERARELRIRSMLGATRQRIGAQLFVEAAVLLSTGCLFGFACAVAVLSNVESFGLVPASVDAGKASAASYLAAVGVTLIGAFVAGFSLRTAARLRRDRTPFAGGRRLRFFRMGFASAELALATVIVTFAASLGLGIYALTHQQLGFDPRDLFLVRFAGVDAGRYADPAARNSMLTALRQAVRSNPGVVAAEWSSITPFGNYPDGEATVAYHGTARHLPVKFGAVGPQYFRVLGAGTSARDEVVPERGNGVAVNQAFLEAFHLGAGARDARIRFTGGSLVRADLLISAVVPDLRPRYELDALPTIYLPLQDHSLGTEALLVRERAGLNDGGKAIFAAVQAHRGAEAPPTVIPFVRMMQVTIQPELSLMATFVLLAAMALGLATSSLYAVLTLEVDERLHEFAVRRAVGASVRRIAFSVFARAITFAAIGTAAGLVVADVANASWTPLDHVSRASAPAPMVAAVALLCLALAISAPPALRAVGPRSLRVLRHE